MELKLRFAEQHNLPALKKTHLMKGRFLKPTSLHQSDQHWSRQPETLFSAHSNFFSTADATKVFFYENLLNCFKLSLLFSPLL